MATMEVNADCVGIGAFCSQHKDGFSGVIKSAPEDFQVQEVSEDGDIAQLDKAEKTGAMLIAPSTQEKVKRENLDICEPNEGWNAFLEVSLGTEVVQRIAGIVLESIEVVDVPAPAHLNDKVRLLHAIQHCYPGVQSNNGKDDDTGHTILKLSLDPVYQKLRHGGVDEDDSNVILAFLLRGPLDTGADAGVALKGNRTKDQRTLIHRVVASATNCLVTKSSDHGGVHVYFSPKTLRRKRKHDTYLQFVLKKTNVDHFTALDILARTCHAAVSDFSVAGTKDKRAVTFQQVVVKNVSHDTLWKAQDTLAAEGLHVGGLRYVERPLSLGQSSGNRFTIRIRDVHAAPQVVQAAMASVTDGGVINYFGYQRVGDPTTVPTRAHHIGHAMLRHDWERAFRLLFSQTQAHDLNLATKQAFLESGNLSQAIKDLPHKCVSERAALMGLKRHGATEYKKAMLQIPYHRRVMYLHAYQSVLFNRMATYRLNTHGRNVVKGDLVLDTATKSIRVVEEYPEREHLDDVVLPLVGTKVVYPNNDVGDKYMELLRAEGVDPATWTQEATVRGAYRSLICRPSHVEWDMVVDAGVVTVSMHLPPGSFATIFLRELMKEHPAVATGTLDAHGTPSDDVDGNPE
ncbi:hypothetical protein, variant 1 [Aphanomyces invadans]|uniref:TRUD domain-containing protein n=1 Tax=Aphanomyces invadans TaxID=157072 RepID=A0A024TWM3_9STRA|nr:hypothetical protein, variant 1 [Aphanomyces invadans]ETV97762.1 hypothetical protein, variant 1 [Aphanomyces invadans]|eukprot:XP_008873323.1 hypothetical protein, variant 1 [Aphanomyces invadans]